MAIWAGAGEADCFARPCGGRPERCAGEHAILSITGIRVSWRCGGRGPSGGGGERSGCDIRDDRKKKRRRRNTSRAQMLWCWDHFPPVIYAFCLWWCSEMQGRSSFSWVLISFVLMHYDVSVSWTRFLSCFSFVFLCLVSPHVGGERGAGGRGAESRAEMKTRREEEEGVEVNVPMIHCREVHSVGTQPNSLRNIR